jgi:hypothetical protein
MSNFCILLQEEFENQKTALKASLNTLDNLYNTSKTMLCHFYCIQNLEIKLVNRGL